MSDKITPIPREEPDAAIAVLCRQIASAWLGAMAYREVDFDFIAQRVGKPETKIRAIVHELVDGKCHDFSFELFSFSMSALDMRITIDLRPRVAQGQIEERSDEISPHEKATPDTDNQDADFPAVEPVTEKVDG